MRRFSGILPLHGAAHKTRACRILWQALLIFTWVPLTFYIARQHIRQKYRFNLFYFTTLTLNTPSIDWSFSIISSEAGCSISSMV